MATEIDDGELIECIKQFPSIYDKNHGDYRNKQSKINAWMNIGHAMGVPEEICEQRWVVLRNRFATELRNRKKNPSGTTTASSLRLFQAMGFLEEYVSPRKTRGSLLTERDRKPFIQKTLNSESNITQTIPPEALVTVEVRSTSPNPNNSNTNNTTRLRPIAPRPTSVPTLARLVSIPGPTDNSVANAIQTTTFTCQNRHNECKDKQEPEDEDILFGKSIGHTLKNIKNKKLKLQIKSEILSILAKHSD